MSFHVDYNVRIKATCHSCQRWDGQQCTRIRHDNSNAENRCSMYRYRNNPKLTKSDNMKLLRETLLDDERTNDE